MAKTISTSLLYIFENVHDRVQDYNHNYHFLKTYLIPTIGILRLGMYSLKRSIWFPAEVEDSDIVDDSRPRNILNISKLCYYHIDGEGYKKLEACVSP